MERRAGRLLKTVKTVGDILTVTLLVYAASFFVHRRGQGGAILSGPPGGTAGHLPRGQQRLTVAAIRLKRHRHICRDGASEAHAAAITRASRNTIVANESHTNMDSVK